MSAHTDTFRGGSDAEVVRVALGAAARSRAQFVLTCRFENVLQMRRCDRGLRAVRAASGDRAQSLWHSAAFSVSKVDVYEFNRICVVMSMCLTTTNFTS